jgi:hypothetical protein
MKGTILDFLKLATEKPELAEELVELAAKYGFEFSDEVSDDELEDVAGGGSSLEEIAAQAEAAIDEAKDAASDSRDLWKQALSVLSDAAKRRAANVATMTRL